jgi:hypothetical protein
MGTTAPHNLDRPDCGCGRGRARAGTVITRKEGAFKALAEEPSSFVNDAQLLYHQPRSKRKKAFCILACCLALATGGQFFTSAMVPDAAPSWNDQSICHDGLSFIGGDQTTAPYAPFYVAEATAEAYCKPSSFWGSGKKLRKKVQGEPANYGHKRRDVEYFAYPPQISFGAASAITAYGSLMTASAILVSSLYRYAKITREYEQSGHEAGYYGSYTVDPTYFRNLLLVLASSVPMLYSLGDYFRMAEALRGDFRLLYTIQFVGLIAICAIDDLMHGVEKYSPRGFFSWVFLGLRPNKEV